MIDRTSLRVEEYVSVPEVLYSIPQAGYNFAMTIVQTGRRSVSGSWSTGALVDGLKFPYFT